MASVPTKILLVDDDPDIQEILQICLKQWGFESAIASNGNEGALLADSFHPDIILSDVMMPDMSGIELLRSLQANGSSRPVILMTGYSTVDMAVEAMKQGARDFLTKPLDYTKLKSVLDAAQKDLKARKQSKKLSSQLTRSGCRPLVGATKVMKDLDTLIRSVAHSDASALIWGESGTGKEVVARCLHDLGKRAAGPFIAVNMAAIPKELIESELFGHAKGAFTGATDERPGCFELANEGTLFLDEIAEMPVDLQTRLLRVLEDGKIRRLGSSEEFTVNVRIIAATNQMPQLAMENGRLREDLYFRLNVISFVLPPLRDRKDDIPLLIQHFIEELNQKHGLSIEAVRDDAMRLLKRYSWPGNVRELKNAIERSAIVARGSSWIESHDLPPYIQNPS
ncbi:MAG: sigma-54 dependent transcriptional regulator, partial [Acidobacteria bacterium]|nr:sigma-54 dependent transcriptional regulator [Acidobacteriota bacterium]